jgi:hypothetical protein
MPGRGGSVAQHCPVRILSITSWSSCLLRRTIASLRVQSRRPSTGSTAHHSTSANVEPPPVSAA